jgi:nucleoside-diphosphate-sugar epimerase
LRYLLTGGAGFIGSALARRLLAEGHRVAVLDDMSRGDPARLSGTGCETVTADVRDQAAVTAAAEGCQSVIHLAYVQGTASFYSRPREVLDIAVRGMLSVLGACEAAGVRELVLASSAEAHQSEKLPTPGSVPLTVPDVLNPRYSYGGGKIACELMAAAAHHEGMLDRVIIARPHNVIGPDMGTGHVIDDLARRMSALAREQPAGVIPLPVQGTGEETRSFCHVDDAVDQFMLLLGHAGPLGTWNVGTRDERTTAQAAHAVADCFGRSIRVVPAELPAGSPRRRQPDMSAMEALGWRQRVPFGQAVRRTVEWYQANG